MDPPSYGRGPTGEVWKLEDNLYPFVELCAGVLSDEPLFIIINSYTTGLQGIFYEYGIKDVHVTGPPSSVPWRRRAGPGRSRTPAGRSHR